MQISMKHARALIGNDIGVTVQSERDEVLASVNVQLDGFDIGDDTLAEGSQSYERIFPGAGGARPGQQHTLVVSVTLADGSVHSATSIWVDA